MVRIHGKQGLIYLVDTELPEASAVTITEVTDSAEGPQFGDGWVERAVGVLHWGGSISVWASVTSIALFNIAIYGASVQLIAYPDRRDTGDYFVGSVILSFEHTQDVGSLAAQTASFEGDGLLRAIGFE